MLRRNGSQERIELRARKGLKSSEIDGSSTTGEHSIEEHWRFCLHAVMDEAWARDRSEQTCEAN
jgi:hypothetical protein